MFEFTDKDLGLVIVRPNKRARRVIARRKAGYVQLTVPVRFSRETVQSVFNSMKPRLLKLKAPAPGVFTENDTLKTFSFDAVILRSNLVNRLKLSFKDSRLTMLIPEDVDITSTGVQQAIRESIRAVLRLEAKRVMHEKVAHFAQKHKLTFNTIKINKSKTRWGSCSGKKNLNFSLFTLLLPEKFINYIVLHELAHTKEMNHSEKFWELLSALCGEDAKKLSRELRKYRHEWYDYLVEE